MMQRIDITALFSCVVLLTACGAPDRPPPSPPNDVQPPATTTGNGEVVGADRVSPATKLDEGPKLDSKAGVEGAATPRGD